MIKLIAGNNRQQDVKAQGFYARLTAFEIAMITKAFKENPDCSVTKAAKVLGIPRVTLMDKIKRFSLEHLQSDKYRPAYKHKRVK